MTPHPPQDTGARCHAGSDGECNWDECPQNREGEPMRSGRSCPLADWSDEEVGYPTGRITKFGAAGSPDRTASRDTPNPTEEQTSPRTFEEFMDADRLAAGSSGNWVDDMHAAWDARQPEIDRLRARTEAALLRHGQHDDECRTVNENVAATACDCSLRRVIREALDG